MITHGTVSQMRRRNQQMISILKSLISLCYSPFSAHDTGLVTLQVAVSNQIISNSVVFEYKARALPSLPSSQHDWLSLDGRSLHGVYALYLNLLCWANCFYSHFSLCSLQFYCNGTSLSDHFTGTMSFSKGGYCVLPQSSAFCWVCSGWSSSIYWDIFFFIFFMEFWPMELEIYVLY